MDQPRAGALLLLSLLCGSQSDSARADEAGSAPQALETVTVTATRREARVRDVAGALGSIDNADVLEAAPDVIAAALRGEAGVFFQQTTPGQGIPIVRGLKGSQLLHLVDGMRLNNAFFRSAPNQYLGLVDAFSVERVELLRGAAGSLYGADAMGGVVQVLTREPRLQGEHFQARGRLYGAWESADRGMVLRADTELGHEGAGFVGGATWQDRSDRRTARGTVSPSAYRSRAADAKVLFDVGARGDLMVSAQVLEQPSTPRVDELVPGFGQTEPASEQFQFDPNRRSFLHARYRLDNPSPALDALEVHLARQVIDDDRVTQDTGSPFINTEQNRSTLDGLTLQVQSKPADAWQLTWGLELYRDAVDSARQRRMDGTASGVAVRPRFPDGSSMDSNAAYLSAQWTGNPRWTLDAGLRYSRFDIRLPESTDVPATRLSPDDVTGDVRAVFHFSDNTNLVANLGRGFRPPNIFDLGTLGPRPGNRFNVANTALKPESVWSYDLGIKTGTGDWEAQVFVFLLDYEDKITTVETGETTPDGRTVVRSENRNQVTLYGLEASLHWLLSESLDGFFSLNWTHGEESDGALTVPADRIPPVNGRLGLNWQWRADLSLRPYVLFARGQDRLSPRDVRDPRIDPTGTDGWVTANVDLRWQWRDGTALGLRLENLADAAYREHGSGIDAPGRNIGLWFETGF